MSWKDNLQPASFRGVPFLIDSHTSTFGRRLQVHEYTKRDLPYAEDLGRKSRHISMTAFILGDDYFTNRNNLLAAVEKPGPGKLVHPYLGSMQVVVEEFSLAESRQDGRMAKFTFRFLESGELTFPSTDNNTGNVVNANADLAGAAVTQNFTNDFVTKGQSDAVTTEAESVLSEALTQIELAGKGLF